MPIFYSALMLTAVNLLLRLVGTLFQVYLSRRVGAAGIGLLQLVMSVGSMALVAGMAGVRTSTMYLTAEELGKGRKENVVRILSGSLRYSILFSGAVAVVLIGFAPRIAQNWIGAPETAPALRLYGAILPLTCLCGVMTGYFTAANRIGTLSAVEVAEQLLSMVVTMTALTFWAGTSPVRACLCVILGSGAGACLTLGCLVYLRQREISAVRGKIGLKRERKGLPRHETSAGSGKTGLWRRLLETALPLAVADDLKTGINTVENLMVPKRLALCTLVANPLASFGVVSGMVFPVLMFPSCILFALAELLIPELARCAAAGSRERIRYLTRRSLKVALLYSLVFGGLECLLAEPLCRILYDDPEAGSNLRIYALLIPMLYSDLITDAILKGLGQQKISVRYNILTSALDVMGLYLLLPRYGMTGYYISFFVTHLINLALSMGRLVKVTQIRIPAWVPVLSLSAAAASMAMASGLPENGARVVGYLGLLGSLLTLFGITGKEDLQWFRGLMKA